MNPTPAENPAREFVKKQKKSFENCWKDNHSPPGVHNNLKNTLVFSQSAFGRHLRVDRKP